MNNPQYTQEQAQLLYDVLVHHNASTLAPTFDQVASKQLNDHEGKQAQIKLRRIDPSAARRSFLDHGD